MSESQLRAHNRVTSALSSAGWNLGSWEQLFEADFDVRPDVRADYATAQFDFRFELYSDDVYIRWSAEGRNESATTLILRLYFEEDPGAIVDELVRSQDTVSADDLGQLTRRLLPLTDDLLVETSDGLARVSLAMDHDPAL